MIWKHDNRSLILLATVYIYIYLYIYIYIYIYLYLLYCIVKNVSPYSFTLLSYYQLCNIFMKKTVK